MFSKASHSLFSPATIFSSNHVSHTSQLPVLLYHRQWVRARIPQRIGRE
jgi:hypothetical protein